MLASIDVGTNTVRMLLGDIVDGQVRPGRYRRRITRLGGGFSERTGLSPGAMARTLEALKDFSREIEGAGIRSVRAVGTEALRKAVNGRQFVRRLEAETGLSLEIISGDEEARLSSGGVLAALSPMPDQCLIFDIGGGSTEFILVEDDDVRFHKSYPLGVVRLAEDVSSSEDLSAKIDSVLDSLPDELTGSLQPGAGDDKFALVGTAGTVTTLAAIDMEMAEYDWRRVNNHRMPQKRLVEIHQRLLRLSPVEREQIPGMEKGREDLIVPGLTIVLKLMRKIHCPSLTVSDFGLLEGVLLGLAETAN